VEEFHGQLKIGGGKKKSAPRLEGKRKKKKVALLLSLWVHGVLYSGEFLTKTTAVPSQEVDEGRS
jgi:hypothetical protein